MTQERLAELKEAYPDQEYFYETRDGYAFLSSSTAHAHAAKLKDKEVDEVPADGSAVEAPATNAMAAKKDAGPDEGKADGGEAEKPEEKKEAPAPKKSAKKAAKKSSAKK